MQIHWNEESILQIQRRGEQHEGEKNNHQRRESLLLLCNTSKTWGKRAHLPPPTSEKPAHRFHRHRNNPTKNTVRGGGVGAQRRGAAREHNPKNDLVKHL